MNTTKFGRGAEKLVADYLKSKKHKIIDMNWRTRWCEIDIVSKRDDAVYFTEVKYRSSSHWGSGFDYITSKKLKQMRFAAEFWITEKKWRGTCTLLAAEVDGDNQIEIIELF